MNKLEIFYKTLFRAFGPQHWWPADTPFEVAVGAILTQNTNWANVEKALRNLKAARVLSAKKLYDTPAAEIAALIRPAGYFTVKTKRLKAFMAFLVENYRGSMKRMKDEDMQKMRRELLSVHGIGPETADSILLYALEKPVFVIDAYTKRVLSRHAIMNYDESYEVFQGLFHSSLKRDARLYNEYHALIVAVGKAFCKPQPLCAQCPLSKYLPRTRL
jgi:endonuclease-3 related protein